MRIAGIDPGPIGGRAAVEIVNGIAPQLVAAIDIPSVGLAAKRRVDVRALRALSNAHAHFAVQGSTYSSDGTTECAP